ncbi:MBL fold metallo-hydrolase [Psychromicrobium xiongbiense]|uniref:MBL fold metallo-hydrolase n=1 Tax=Psychromicrobium xiongbiense TaxID=3051184 RepID=UPI00255286EB|nr:MBL fold metallo-hydrolase [Psychromicrobium sp. YIM S02556]
MNESSPAVTVEFFGGLRVIGSSKIMVSTDSARVLLDMGLDIPGEQDLFRDPVQERPEYRLRDRLAVGFAAELPGIYDPDQLPEDSPLAVPDPRPSAIFLSHAHLDHDGALSFVRAGIPVYAHPETVRLEQSLALAGLGEAVELRPMDGVVEVGDLRVEAIPVDHDIPGACGFLVHTPEGTLAYTGDLNFHRDGALRSEEFIRRATGVGMLVTETTMLSFDIEPGHQPRSEDAILELLAQTLAEAPGLALLSMYERDAERAQRFIDLAASRGRTLVWPGQQAAMLAHFGVHGAVTWDASRPQRPVHQAAIERLRGATGTVLPTVSLREVRERPSRYLVQPDVRDVPALLDLPRRSGEFLPFLHSQGEPLGPFMANWATWLEWLERLGISFVAAGSSGHATGEALHKMVMEIHPGVVVPIHGFRPEALAVDVPTLLPTYGARYRLDGTEIPSWVRG